MLKNKFKDSILAISPMFIVINLLNFRFIRAPSEIYIKFLISSIFLVVGLTIFLVGAQIGLTEFGDLLGVSISKFKSHNSVILLALVLGFIITVAEPDLVVLSKEVAYMMGGINNQVIIISVALGLAVMMSLGFLRLLIDFDISKFFAISYAIVLILALFVKDEFNAIAFDSSGATTGAVTTPFIIALGIGLARLKGSVKSDSSSFGLVGISSIGPILAVMIFSLISENTLIAPLETNLDKLNITKIFNRNFLIAFKETSSSLALLTIILLIFNYRYFKLSKAALNRILKGFFYTLLGLSLFLTGVFSGFMELAELIGIKMSNDYFGYLPLLGFLLGILVVMAEPAVYMLSREVEDVTGGNISRKMILICLSLGVGIAISASLIRIMYGFKLTYILIFGFLIATIVSFKIPKLFVGIAFDSGAVASGPMTTTFLLAFGRGVAMTIGTNPFAGFGIIAFVAMMPIITISLLGYIYSRRVS